MFYADSFLPTPAPGEDYLKLRDNSGAIRYKIYNNTITSLIITGDTVIIKTQADSKILRLKFPDQTQAQSAITQIETAYGSIRANHNASKDSKFSDNSFEVYDNFNTSHGIKFDLSNLSTTQILQFGTGNTIITDAEFNDVHNTISQYRFFDHFLTSTTLQSGTFSTGSVKSVANTATQLGIIGLSLTSANSDAYLWSGVNAFLLKNKVDLSFSMALNTLPTIADDYRIAIGFINNNSFASISKGSYFTFDSTLSSNWLAKSQNSTSTIQNTMHAIDTNWHLFRITLNVLLQEIEFYIDNVLVASTSTNIPIQLGSEVAFGVVFEKTTHSQSTTLMLDYTSCQINL